MTPRQPIPTACLATICLALCVATAHAEMPEITFQSLLDEMIDRDAAAQFPEPAYTCRQASSYDRASVSPDDAGTWMANNDRSFFIRSETNGGREEWVMLDAEGPGCIVRIWATSGNPIGNIRIYLDGSQEPVINEPAKKLIGGDALVGPPLSEVRARGMNLYLPIPYAKHCKITYDRPNFHTSGNQDDLLYYQINYRTYESAARVEPFAAEGLRASRAKIDQLQKTLLNPDRAVASDLVWTRAMDRKLAPGEVTTLRHTSGSGAIRTLVVRLQAENLPAATRSTVLSLKFDDRETVVCPVGDFFGSGVGVNPYTDWWRTVDDDGGMTCFWVMPYRKSWELALQNRGTDEVTASAKVATGPWEWDDRSMHFHTNWRHEYPIDSSVKRDWNYVHIQGKGVYMGDTLCVANPVRAWWGEGDEKIYIDDEPFPSHFGTGTEDYYGYAWCTPDFFEAPFHSQPLAEGPGNFGQVTNSRVRLLDGIPFRKSLRFDMEVWHWASAKVSYAAATHWYGLPGAAGNHTPQPEMLRVIAIERPKPRKVKGAIEGEGLDILQKTGGVVEIQDIEHFRWSDNKQIWWRDAKPGDRLLLKVPVAQSGKYSVSGSLTKAIDYGIVQLSLDGKTLGDPIDLFNQGVTNQVYEFGEHQLEAGDHQLTIEITGANPKAIPKHMFGIDYLKLDPVE